MKIKISKYTKLGFLILACLAILIWGINFLKGIDLFKRNSSYYVVYNRIDGLLKSSLVTVNGFQIGQVSDVELMEDNSGRILATLSLQGDFKIAKGSSARIVSSDLMGTRAIKLIVAKSNEYYRSNDTIPGEIEGDLKEQVSMQVLPLKTKAEELIASLDSALTVITYVFNERTRDNLKESFENINRTVANIESASDELNKIITSGKVNSIVSNLDGITTTINKNSKEITSIIQNLAAMSDSLSKLNINPLFAQIDSTVAGLNHVVLKLNSEESSAGRLLNDPALYNNLNSLTSSLDLLLKDIRNNPKRYVHFSAFNIGKDVYITARPANQEEKDKIIYKVRLISSPAKLSTGSVLFRGLGEIEETKANEIFVYYAGKLPDFEKASELLQAARTNFPDATIVAFKNGRRLKIENALKNRAN